MGATPPKPLAVTAVLPDSAGVYLSTTSPASRTPLRFASTNTTRPCGHVVTVLVQLVPSVLGQMTTHCPRAPASLRASRASATKSFACEVNLLLLMKDTRFGAAIAARIAAIVIVTINSRRVNPVTYLRKINLFVILQEASDA